MQISRQLHLYQDFLGVLKHRNGSQAKTLKYFIFLVNVTMLKEPMNSWLLSSTTYPLNCPREQIKCAYSQTAVLLKAALCSASYAWTFTKVHGLSNVRHFPVWRLSFLPANRAFGRVWKRLRRIESILRPSDYYWVFSEIQKLENSRPLFLSLKIICNIT